MTAKPYVVTGKALIRDHRGRILLIKRSMSCKNFKGQWELPGGKADPGETIDAALRREIKEETGLVLGDLHLSGVVEAEIPAYRLAVVIFEIVAEPGEVELSDEHTAFTWASPAEAVQLDLCPAYIPFMRTLAGLSRSG